MTPSPTLGDVPSNVLASIMRRLSVKNAAKAAGASASVRAAVEEAFPSRPRGPKDYLKRTGRFQKKYNALRKTMKKREAACADKLARGEISDAEAERCTLAYYADREAFDISVAALKENELVTMIHTHWKPTAYFKRVLKKVKAKLRAMGRQYAPALKALRKVRAPYDETHATRVMDAIVLVLDAGTLTHK